MDALRRIYEKYKSDLLGVARVLLNDAAGVEDVLHDVFVRFASQAGCFRLKGSLKGYLTICVANRARNINRMGRQNRREIPFTEAGTSSRTEPSQAADCFERRRIVTCALAQLPPEQRQVVVLHVLSSLRFRQIAQHTGESVNTIQSRYRYGLAKLQSLLNGEVDL
jgi:RNA polymerase sigma-70 factor (ECF subfamily)